MQHDGVDEMFERLQSIEDRYEKVNQMLADPEVINDPAKLRKYSKEQSDLQEVVTEYRSYKQSAAELADDKTMLDEPMDASMKKMVADEINRLEMELETLREQLKQLLIPKDPNDDRNVILEIRSAAGGDEAALLPVIYCACIHATRSSKTGKRRLLTPVLMKLAVIKKLSV
ncbi:peptide chain release factor 1 [Sporolactobacillus inulinus]|uniref:Peptide chain release factor 1 n=1 Tax=Sporolactobacillus inulinus TaxID=2078 RepID=A0A4Y1ZFC4_9BACL|nr:peptide chain release factor 1 [Sporolactobacillus inulinus]